MMPKDDIARNQCDGCRRGLPVVDGLHRGRDHWDAIACTANRYGARAMTEETKQGQDNACLLLLADIREACGDNGKRMQDELVDHIVDINKKASERDELQAEVEHLQDSVIRMGEILTGVVNITKGPPPENGSHSTHDAVESVEQMQRQVLALREALSGLVGPNTLDSLCQQEPKDFMGRVRGTWSKVAAEYARQALTDTAQAGREAAEEERRKGFWSGFEIARMNPDSHDIQKHWAANCRLRNGGSPDGE